MLNRRMPNGTYWWCERGIKFPLLDCKKITAGPRKNPAKFLIKLADFVAECEQLYDLRIVCGDTIKIHYVKKLRKKLYALKQSENVVFVYGAGKRKTPFQKSMETLKGYLCRLKEYNQKIYICGERNSYSKTDRDATFMRMKEDAMGNGLLKYAIFTE